MARRIALPIAALLLSLVSAELGLRLLGYRPFRVNTSDPSMLMPWARPDSELGWTLRPGAVVPMGKGHMTVWSDASRATRPHEQSGAATYVAIVGCSYTQGFDVRDEAAFPWVLQTRFPDFDIRNYGTGGYGSYQSLLSLRRHFAHATKPTALVIYGLGSFHGIRDRASRTWLEGLKPRGRLLFFIPPHIDVDGRGLVESPPRSVNVWPAAEYSALAHLVQRAYVSRIAVTDDDAIKEVEAQIRALERMRDLSRERGARFLVAVLYANPDYKKAVYPRLAQAGIDRVDCSPADLPFQHPDEHWNGRYAACVADGITRLGPIGR